MNGDAQKLTGRWCPPQTTLHLRLPAEGLAHHQHPKPWYNIRGNLCHGSVYELRGMKSASLIIKNYALGSTPLIRVLVYSWTSLSTMKLNVGPELVTPELNQVCNEFGSLTPWLKTNQTYASLNN